MKVPGNLDVAVEIDRGQSSEAELVVRFCGRWRIRGAIKRILAQLVATKKLLPSSMTKSPILQFLISPVLLPVRSN